LWGRSQAAEEIRQLQLQVQKLTEVNRAREEEIRSLNATIYTIRKEIREISQRQRGILNFLAWLFTGFPEVLRLYKEIRRAKAESKVKVTKIDYSIRSIEREIDSHIKQLAEKYPSVLKDFGSAISQEAANSSALSAREKRRLAAQIESLSRN